MCKFLFFKLPRNVLGKKPYKKHNILINNTGRTRCTSTVNLALSILIQTVSKK